MSKKLCITFAGAIGSSKTPIAHHLGWNLNLPIFNNDTIRTEVSEDCNGFDQIEFERRRDERLRIIAETGKPFIYDASVDRFWGDNRKMIVREAGYDIFVISIDLSKDKLQKIYTSKGYMREDIDKWLNDHELFLQKYPNDINLHITDSTFNERLNICLDAVQKWMQT